MCRDTVALNGTERYQMGPMTYDSSPTAANSPKTSQSAKSPPRVRFPGLVSVGAKVRARAQGHLEWRVDKGGWPIRQDRKFTT